MLKRIFSGVLSLIQMQVKRETKRAEDKKLQWLNEQRDFVTRMKEEQIARKIQLDEARKIADARNKNEWDSYIKRVGSDQQIILKKNRAKAAEMQRILEFNTRQTNYKKELEEQERTYERIHHEKMIEEVNKFDSCCQIEKFSRK